MYAFNDGICYLYKRLKSETKSGLPEIKKDEATKRMFYFNELAVSEKEHYDALLADVAVERRIEILYRKDVSPKDIVEMGDESYTIIRTAPVIHKTGIRVLKITLEGMKMHEGYGRCN